jgi:hypothetical protein
MNHLDTIFEALADILQKMPKRELEALRASKAFHARYEELKRKSFDQTLNLEEQEELTHFKVLDRLLQATAEKY